MLDFANADAGRSMSRSRFYAAGMEFIPSSALAKTATPSTTHSVNANVVTAVLKGLAHAMERNANVTYSAIARANTATSKIRSASWKAAGT